MPVQLRDAVDRQRVLAALHIGPTFSRDVAAGRAPDVQIILDGRRSNASQIVSGYLSQIVERFADEAARPGSRPARRVQIEPRNWFNPNLEFTWFTVPGLIAIIALLVGLIVTALSVARERELGTFDQLMVSPLRTHEVLIGKMLPPLLIGLVHITLYVLAAALLFQVPLRGSLLLLYGSAILYLAAVVGLGLFISSLCADPAAGHPGRLPVHGPGGAAVRLRHADREHARMAADGHAGQPAALLPRHRARACSSRGCRPARCCATRCRC